MKNAHGVPIHYFGETKTFAFEGKVYPATDEIENAIVQANWARGILAGPNTVWPNGRESHSAASDVLEQSLATLCARELFGPNGPIAAPNT